MKIFGNDLKYVTFNGASEIKNGLNALKPTNLLKRVLSQKVRKIK